MNFILEVIIQCVDEYAITLITGARQVEKTTLVSYFKKERDFTYLSFDDTDLLFEAKNNPKEFIRKHKSPLILDEVQRVPDFYRDNNQNEIDLIILNDGKLDLIECKSGKKYGIEDIKGFKQLAKTRYEINGECIICTTSEPYRIRHGVYAFPIKCI